MPTIGIYFDGIEYLIADSTLPHWGRCKNNTAVGVQIVLDREDANDVNATTAIRILKKPPLTIIVRPQGVDADKQYAENIPQGCVPFVRRKGNFTVKLKERQVQVHRSSIALSPAYAVTDYYAQGMTYNDDTVYFTEFLPPRGPMKKESTYVTLTRHRNYSQLHALNHLFDHNDINNICQTHVFKRYFKVLTQPDRDKDAEVQRMQEIYQRTRERHAALYSLYNAQ